MQSTSAHSQKKTASSRIESNALLTSCTRSFTRRKSASLRAARSPRSAAPCNALCLPFCSVRLPHDVVAIKRPDYVLTFAGQVPTDHHVVLRPAGDAFPLLHPQLDSSVTELVGALAQERDATVVGHRVAHGAVQPLVPAPEKLLVLVPTRVPRSHASLESPRSQGRKPRTEP